MRLFVIGNGFDLAHDMDTRYSDFRDYLEAHEPEFLMQFEMAYGFGGIDEGDPYSPSLNEYYNRIKKILWWDFENNLSSIDADNIIDNVVGMDLGLEMGNIGVLDTMNDHLDNEYSYISRLNGFIYNWIRTIGNPKGRKTKLINESRDDVYLTFNYTNVLEELYGIEEYYILHIHGSADEHDLDPVIGHGNKHLIVEMVDKARSASDYFDEMAESAYRAVANYYERTLKDVEHFLSLNRNFFNKITDVREVHIIGHSLGDVDMPYLKEIYKNSSEDTKWIVYYHEPEDQLKFKAKIEDIGVHGSRIDPKHSSVFYDMQC